MYRARRLVVDGPHGIEMSGHVDEQSFDLVIDGRTYAVGLDEAHDLMMKLALVIDDVQRQGREETPRHLSVVP